MSPTDLETDGSRAPAVLDEPVRHLSWKRDRVELLHLFELADDSAQRIREYLHAGDVIVAATSNSLLGHAQVLQATVAGEFELKSIAVREEERGRGLGSNLLEAAIRYCRERHGRRLIVSTAIASLSALHFYLRRGFRPTRVERDAFSPANGYPVAAQLDGVPLIDAIVLELDLRDQVHE